LSLRKQSVLITGNTSRILAISYVLVLVLIVLNLPAIRQIVVFLYLSFVPGFLLLSLVKHEKIGFLEEAILSIGLSLAFLMFLGFFTNFLYRLLGISNPMSPFWLIISISGAILVLYTVARYRKKLPEQTHIDLRFSPVLFVIVCIPFVTVLGAEQVNLVGNNSVLLILILLDCFILLACLSKKLVPPHFFPWVIWVLAFSLLFHISLSSSFLIGWDVHTEYYFAMITSANSWWNPTIPHQYNGMLSVTILPVIFSAFLGLEIEWVLKIIYPLIFSLVPVGLYLAYRKKISPTAALFAVGFFMATETYYVQMLGLARQMIAEFFLMELIILTLEDRLSTHVKEALFVVFGAGLIVSHYALSYIFWAYLLVAFCITKVLKRTDKITEQLVTFRVLISYSIFVIFWYLFVSPSLFTALANVITHIAGNILAQASAPGIGGLMPTYLSTLHNVSKYLFLFPQLLVVIGISILLFKRGRRRFGLEFSSMSIASMFILILCIIVPSFASSLNMTRFYHIAQFFLAPFGVLGAMVIANLFSRTKAKAFNFEGSASLDRKKLLAFLVVMLLIFYFLFQTGFIYEVVHDVPTSISLSRNRIREWPPSLNDLYVDEPEFKSAKWLSVHKSQQSRFLVDFGVKYLTSYASVSPDQISPLDSDNQLFLTDKKSNTSYVYLGRLNVVYGLVEGSKRLQNMSDFSSLLNEVNKIYSNGESDVYLTP
jgi:uncharacterized membrane protein